MAMPSPHPFMWGWIIVALLVNGSTDRYSLIVLPEDVLTW